MENFKKLTAYDESVRSTATDHTEAMIGIKDKPDFEKMAKEAYQGMIEDDEDTDYVLGYYNGCEYVWTAHVEPLQAEKDKLKKFKEYVHDRLDKMGVPSDPEPANNASHGCRIEGRLNFVQSDNQKLREHIKALIGEFNEKARINDENADKVKPTDTYYLGRASSFSDAAKMLQNLLKLDKTNP